MQAKFRPSLSLEEIQFLITNLSGHQTDLAYALRAKLQLLTAKVNLGITKPAFVTVPKEDIMNKLGGDSNDLSPKQKREMAYIKYQGAPDKCSEEEIKLARTYMYNNNMLTTSEIDEYEKDYFGDM